MAGVWGSIGDVLAKSNPDAGSGEDCAYNMLACGEEASTSMEEAYSEGEEGVEEAVS